MLSILNKTSETFLYVLNCSNFILIELIIRSIIYNIKYKIFFFDTTQKMEPGRSPSVPCPWPPLDIQNIIHN